MAGHFYYFLKIILILELKKRKMYKRVEVLEHNVDDVILRPDVVERRYHLKMPDNVKEVLRNRDKFLKEGLYDRKTMWKFAKGCDVKLNRQKFMKDFTKAVSTWKSLNHRNL